jgi:xanthosine utilization system XapX-like protein
LKGIIQNTFLKKGLIIGIIQLFVGISIIPTITATASETHSSMNLSNLQREILRSEQTASPNIIDDFQKNDLVEITVKIYGIPGAKPITRQITQQQYLELISIFNDLKKRLDNMEKKENAAITINKAIVDLRAEDLLPPDVSIKQIQELFSQTLNGFSLINEKTRILRNLPSGIQWNIACVTIGRSVVTSFSGGPILLTLIFLRSLMRSSGFLLRLIADSNPISFCNLVFLGDHSGRPIIPATGWITTIGLHGKQTLNGSFYGKLTSIGPLLGIVGFVGIQIGTPIINDEHFYLGISLFTSISDQY